MRAIHFILFAFFLLLTLSVTAQSCQEASVQLTANVQSSPPRITLNWLNNGTATQYIVYRKLKTATAWGGIFATLSATANQFIDSTVQVGVSYEYYVRGVFPTYNAYGNINAGIEVTAIEERGILILMVDSLFTNSLSAEISQLVQDLEGDGWGILRHDVSRNASVSSIKSLIVSDYNANPVQTKALFLLGHIPVPYSGNLNPDGHPDHQGAWPADVFYADVNGSWTDASVNNVVASATRNQNIPGDGKYDQTNIPSNVELQVGRVDFYDMPAFAATETQLMQNYLIKDHDYKHKNFTVNRQAVIDDNFGYFSGEAFAATGWKNFSTLVGTTNITENDYFTSMTGNSYLWSYGCGGGTYTSAGGVGSTSDFATANLQSVFTMLFGSYFGDWDSQNNFLRAPLAQGKTLVNMWAGRPHWALHHLALGENIGYSTLVSQNNSNLYFYNYGARMVHIALMGDPTLRNDVVAPPTNVTATVIGNNCQISWTASTDTVLGYYLYVKSEANPNFVRITNSPIIGNSYTQNCLLDSGIYTYSVRAIKLEHTPSGTYYNMSQGVMDTAFHGANLHVVANFIHQQNCNQIQFFSTSQNASTQTWDFGDASAGSTSLNPTHTYPNPGTYTVTLVSYQACALDTMTLSIAIPSAIIASTTVSGTTISAVIIPNAVYTWVDCNNAFSPIAGATNSDYTVTTNGNYAVIIANVDCRDTSACVPITSVSISENESAQYSIYPNPSTGRITIQTGNIIADTIWITDAIGKRVWQIKPSSNQILFQIEKKGVFFVFAAFKDENKILGKVLVE